ncbi:hypothetical protein [Marinobacter sp. ANT_B65]|uniref:hypothetical protein n=1 Tax=Marinobacter sp. ANT_B65 TaxID=2039467 RepID=UPI000BBEA8B8|nr:hypothetical protein [Marinobacter sp. ANT_B65]PCM44931.1 hypothetical protein CPA50_02605 [Marinobacter sp. ANT_B65]
MEKQYKTPTDKAMPEYQVLPKGMWHMLGAVMLMVFSLPIVLMLLSALVSGLLSERALVYLEMALLVVMVLFLATPTFLLSRGWSVCHRVLLWQNLFYVLLLAAATCTLFFLGSTGMAFTGLAGVIMAVLAGMLYRSERYGNVVEYYRLIWSQHRSNSKR